MSIDKGKRYERKIAKLLSEWSGIELVRTPDGAPEDLYADIWPKKTTDYFPLAVECKHWEGWSFDQIMSKTGPFWGWLDQAFTQASNATLELGRPYAPMLVFSKNRCQDYVAVYSLYGLVLISLDISYLSTSALSTHRVDIYELQTYLKNKSYADVCVYKEFGSRFGGQCVR